MARNKYLNDYYLLERAIKELEGEIREIEAAFAPPSRSDITKSELIELCAMREKLRAKKQECELHKANVERYIEEIPDLFTQRIFEKHIFRRMKFKQIANELGGGNTEECVRTAFNRYLKRNPIPCCEGQTGTGGAE